MPDRPFAEVELRPLRETDAETIAAPFAQLGWNKPAAQYERYFDEQRDNVRSVIVAWLEEEFAGYVTIVWQSEYAPFCEAQIPEIVDLNVLPQHRRRHIGTQLLGRAEELIFERSITAGIGVGMDPDYGPAQCMYATRGYVPDGRGLTYNRLPVSYGQVVTVDDKLILHLIKHA